MLKVKEEFYLSSQQKLLFIQLLERGVGLPIYWLFNAMKMAVIGYFVIGIIITAIFALIGFSIATFKIPESPNWEITRKNGGQNIDDVIVRAIKFKMKKSV